jgi:hypothetical protein
MNRFLVVDTIRLNAINRYALTGAVREGDITAGMRVVYRGLAGEQSLDIMKVDVVAPGATTGEHHVALLLRLEDVTDCGLQQRELWIGKEVDCE